MAGLAQSRVKELLPTLLAESFAFAVIAEAGIGALRRMNTLSMPAVCAVFLTSNLAQGGPSHGASFVDHPVFELVSGYSVSDDHNFFLWQSNGLPASGTNVTTHSIIRSSPSTNGR